MDGSRCTATCSDPHRTYQVTFLKTASYFSKVIAEVVALSCHSFNIALPHLLAHFHSHCHCRTRSLSLPLTRHPLPHLLAHSHSHCRTRSLSLPLTYHPLPHLLAHSHSHCRTRSLSLPLNHHPTAALTHSQVQLDVQHADWRWVSSAARVDDRHSLLHRGRHLRRSWLSRHHCHLRLRRMRAYRRVRSLSCRIV
jgi:hypothetical protein